MCVGREEERTTRARKATKGDIEAGRQVFQLEGVEGDWMEQWDMRSKYLRRDTKVWNLSYAQFARMLETASASRRSKDEDTGDQREDVEVDKMEDNLEDTATDGQDMDEPWDVPFKKVMMCSHLCCNDQAKADCEEVCCQSSPKRNNFKKKSNKVKRAKDVPEFMELREPYVGEP